MRPVVRGLVAVALLGAACRTQPSLPCDAGGPECIVLTIPRGATLSAAVDSLTAHRSSRPAPCSSSTRASAGWAAP